MGIPLCVALFGAESLAPAAFATLLTASVLFGCAIALIELDRQQAPGLGATLLKVGQALMRNPLLAAPVAGLAWAAGIALPEGLDRYVTLLGASASPCALVAIGLFLAQTETASPGPGVLRLVLGKLLLQPAATAALAFLVFDMPPLWAWTAVLMSALPIGTGPSCWRACTGATPADLARHPRFDPGLGAHHQPAGGLDQRPSHQLTSQLKALPCCLPPRSSS